MTDPYKPPEADLAIDATENWVLASRWLRLGGWLIDTFILVAIVYGMGYLLASHAFINSLLFGPTVLLLAVIPFLLLNIYLIYTRAQTLGKLICKTKVISLDGKQVSGNTYLFVRLLPFWIVAQIPVVGQAVTIVDTLLIFRDEKNCLHDDLANTRVVKV